jgi:hypothetical protein
MLQINPVDNQLFQPFIMENLSIMEVMENLQIGPTACPYKKYML